MTEANSTALQNLLKSITGDGKQVFVFHGHLHGGSLLNKDGVVYVCSGTTRAGLKDDTWGTFVLAAADAGSQLQSIAGYGGVDGSAGWIAARYSQESVRVRIFDSYCDSDGYHVRKRYEQRRLVR